MSALKGAWRSVQLEFNDPMTISRGVSTGVKGHIFLT
jgi:hypothetical protein